MIVMMSPPKGGSPPVDTRTKPSNLSPLMVSRQTFLNQRTLRDVVRWLESGGSDEEKAIHMQEYTDGSP